MFKVKEMLEILKKERDEEGHEGFYVDFISAR